MKPGFARLAVLISGNGTNLQAIMDACGSGSLPAKVVVVVSNKAEAFGLERAARVGVPTAVLQKTGELDRWAYDTQLAKLVKSYQPDWVILAGWMRILTSAFLESFHNRVVNLHPALPGAFPGVKAIERAFQAYQQGEITQTGVMVHLVPDEGVDCGPVLGQAVVPILPDDTLSTLETRIHQVEHSLLIQTLNRILPDSSMS